MTAEEGLPSYKKIIRLPASIGDWTTLRPARETKKKITGGLRGFDRMSEDAIEDALFLHYRFFEVFTKGLGKSLETNISLNSIEAQQLYYIDYMRRTSNPLVHIDAKLKDSGSISFFIDVSFTNSIINRAISDIDSKNVMPRGLTEAEEQILLVTLTEHLSNIQTVFKNIFEVSDISVLSSPTPKIEHSINPNDTFIVFQAEVDVAGYSKSKISIGYIYSTLREIMSKFDSQPKEQINMKKLPMDLKDKITVQVKALLGNTFITSKELNNLEVGDVLTTDSMIDGPNTLIFGDQFETSGQIGIKNGKIALQIIKKGNEVPANQEESVKEIDIPEEYEQNEEQTSVEEEPKEIADDFFNEETASEPALDQDPIEEQTEETFENEETESQENTDKEFDIG